MRMQHTNRHDQRDLSRSGPRGLGLTTNLFPVLLLGDRVLRPSKLPYTSTTFLLPCDLPRPPDL